MQEASLHDEKMAFLTLIFMNLSILVNALYLKVQLPCHAGYVQSQLNCFILGLSPLTMFHTQSL